MRLFDKMKSSISSAGTGVSQKISYTTDTAKLNSQIRNNDKEIEKLTYQVGLKCVQMHLNDTGSEYEELFAQIRSLQETNAAHQAEIQRLTEELKALEQLRQQEMKERQEQREQEYNEKERLKKQQIQQRQAEEQERAEMARQAEQEKQAAIQDRLDKTTKLCKNCNQRNDLDSKFCVNCGTPFSNTI